jgi:hypothetical protein
MTEQMEHMFPSYSTRHQEEANMKSRSWWNYKKGSKIITHACKFHGGICKIREGFQPRTSLCIHKHRVIAEDEKGILEVRADYFKELLNPLGKEIILDQSRIL